ncbi:MAG: hypothetical protein NPMRD1_380016 [Nitrosopumilales archaeon]|nr:MAG: hypothetical protein NPMRD1_380016 [Nitrosopumilales archaeon]
MSSRIKAKSEFQALMLFIFLREENLTSYNLIFVDFDPL